MSARFGFLVNLETLGRTAAAVRQSCSNVCALPVRTSEHTRKRSWAERRVHGSAVRVGSSLVDPASSHMLVSKIKPCMSQYIPK